MVLNKDGSFQRTARFRGPDLDSATESELVATAARLNNALRRFESGWALFVEARARRGGRAIRTRPFPKPCPGWSTRSAAPRSKSAGSHFESAYRLTLLWLPPAEAKARASRVMLETTAQRRVDWREHLAAFIGETERFRGLARRRHDGNRLAR